MSVPATTLSFTVLGRPQQRGSKRASLIPKRGGGWLEKNGRPVVVARDMNERSQEWMSLVRDAASAAYSGELLRGPVRLNVKFFFVRPACHLGTGKRAGTLKASAPVEHAQAPDLSKLIRCLEDALSGVLIGDDRQICAVYAEKRWTLGSARTEVEMFELGGKMTGHEGGSPRIPEHVLANKEPGHV